MSPTLKLRKSNRSRVLKGHPWVFRDEVETLLEDHYNGYSVELLSHQGYSLGSGIYNAHSQILWRRFSFQEGVKFDSTYLELAIKKAIEKRAHEPYCRLVWSESDHIPGLIVDRFDTVLVVQALTLAVDRKLSQITEILKNILSPTEIIYRNDASVRELEGLDKKISTYSGKVFEASWFSIEGIDYWIDLEKGQKTGFYLDQRIQAKNIAQWASGKRVLDGFCNQGSFALHAAKAGAAEVIAVDISSNCLELAAQNAKKNNTSIEFICSDMFDFFSNNRDQRFDLIILDPPAFAKSKQHVPGALRGYKELNLRALKMLTPNGILATYSCSQHIIAPLFIDMLSSAAADAKREVELIEQTIQAPDHPIILTMPESWYLKGAIVKAL